MDMMELFQRARTQIKKKYKVQTYKPRDRLCCNTTLCQQISKSASETNNKYTIWRLWSPEKNFSLGQNNEPDMRILQ